MMRHSDREERSPGQGPPINFETIHSGLCSVVNKIRDPCVARHVMPDLCGPIACHTHYGRKGCAENETSAGVRLSSDVDGLACDWAMGWWGPLGSATASTPQRQICESGGTKSCREGRNRQSAVSGLACALGLGLAWWSSSRGVVDVRLLGSFASSQTACSFEAWRHPDDERLTAVASVINSTRTVS